MKRIYLVSYDVTDNKKRKKLADKLRYLGLERIQYSVFLGVLSPTLHQQLLQYTQPLFAKEDKLIILRIPRLAVQQMLQYGDEKLDLDYIAGNTSTLYIF